MAMMAADVIWHGDQQESEELVAAIARNCMCEFGLMGVRITTCVPHQAMTSDQRWLDGLLFERQLRACLLREEGVETP